MQCAIVGRGQQYHAARPPRFCICDVLCDTKYIMNTIHHALAAAELLLVVPAALFVRDIQPAHYEPARTAGRLVDWFSARPLVGLDVFLIALPFAVFVTGCTTLVRRWRRDPEFRRAALETLPRSMRRWRCCSSPRQL
jgi:hypothetical protein